MAVSKKAAMVALGNAGRKTFLGDGRSGGINRLRLSTYVHTDHGLACFPIAAVDLRMRGLPVGEGSGRTPK